MIEQIEKYVQEKSKEYEELSEDSYDFWNEHIKYVYQESIFLANKYHADEEIVKLAALLHDIALINKVGDRKNHHINGEKIAREILTNLNYDNDKKEKVLKCILHHRSSLNGETIEEICVADADILAHFDNIPMLFNSAFVRNKCNLKEARIWLKEVLEKDYNELSKNTKELFKNRYEEIIDILKL